MTIQHLCVRSCQLFDVNNDYYRLTQDGITLDDVDTSLGDNIDMYELIALTDNRAQINFNLSMEDIHQLFSSHSTTIPLELKKEKKTNKFHLTNFFFSTNRFLI